MIEPVALIAASASGFGLVFRMLEAAQQVFQVIRHLARRFFDLASDLSQSHRIIKQQSN